MLNITTDKIDEWTIIHRTKSFPMFFIGTGAILFIIGLYLLYISIDIIINERMIGLIILVPSSVVFAISVYIIWWKSSLLKPALIKFNHEQIQLFVDKKLKKEIKWNEKIEIRPLFNHALGLNAYYGFSVKCNRTQISASPDDGWPLIELKFIIPDILQIAISKKVKLSESFDLIDWLDVSKLRTPRSEQVG